MIGLRDVVHINIEEEKEELETSDPSHLTGKAIEIMKQVKEDYKDYLDNHAEDGDDKRFHKDLVERVDNIIVEMEDL